MTTHAIYHVTDEDVAEYTPSILIYEINLLVGAVCFTLTFTNSVVLVTTYKFRKQFSMLILLSFSEMISLMGIMLEATMRRQLFIEATRTRIAEVRTSRSCLLPWTLLQVAGDFWSPSLVVLMGIERVCAVIAPSFFHNAFVGNMHSILIFVTLYSYSFVIVPTLLNIFHPTPNVRWSCGRKAAFGTTFGFIDYGYNVSFYTVAFMLNLIAIANALKVHHSRRNMAKLKCYTLMFSSKYPM
uniref:G protein-coupled receptor n=1 Tax=Panagrellus redivivus TaxID=6233 RepID=A0A7E4VX65_PANRE